jgi:hypothetical protein
MINFGRVFKLPFSHTKIDQFLENDDLAKRPLFNALKLVSTDISITGFEMNLSQVGVIFQCSAQATKYVNLLSILITL